MLAIITARHGSKGVPKKNILKIGGLSLISWTIRHAKKSREIGEIIISTDHIEIANIAQKEGCIVPFLRPENLSTDFSDSASVILHAINSYKSKFEDIILLQPTSPLRNHIDINNAVKIYKKNKTCYSVVSFEELNLPLEMIYQIDEQKKLINITNQKDLFRRQDVQKTFKPNGGIYIFNKKVFKEKKVFINEDTVPYIMPTERSLDIDTWDDISYLKYLSDKNPDIVPKP